MILRSEVRIEVWGVKTQAAINRLTIRGRVFKSVYQAGHLVFGTQIQRDFRLRV